MNAWEVLNLLDATVDKEYVDQLINHYSTLYQTAQDPITVARAATNLGLAFTFVPNARFSEVLEYLKEGLNGLTDPFERVRIHYELGQLLTRPRKDVFFEQAREHYHFALTELKQAKVKHSTIGSAILNGLALISYLEGQFDEALALEQRALFSLFCLPEAPEVWQQRMITALRTGDVYRKKIEYTNARDFYQIALYCAKHTDYPNDVTLVQKSFKSIEKGRKSNAE